MTIEDRAEEIASDLGADIEEVKQDLENLLEYSVPMEEAVQSLRRKYGDGEADTAETPTPTDIADISPDDSSVTVTATVLTVGTRSIRYQGEDQVIREGEVADETGQISYTAWEEFDFTPGDTVTFGNANVREWDGEPELNLGNATQVSKATESLDIDADIGGDRAIIDLAAGDRGRNVEVTVIEVENRVIDGRDGETDILSGVVADETGRLPFTDWDPHESITEGATLRLENVYIREFRGVPSINISEFSTVESIDREIEPPAATRLSVREAVETGGVYDLEIRGNVVGIRDGSGLIQRCPECNRVVEKGQCRTHGEVDAYDDLRVKAILDDGTGTVTAVLDEDLTAEIYGGDLEDARAQAREAMDQSVVANTIEEEILGYEFDVRGNLSVDDYGATLEVTAFDAVDEDPADRAAAVLEATQ